MTLPWHVIFLAPPALAMLFLFLAAAYYRRRRPIRHKPSRAIIFRCQRCLKVYLDQRRVPLSRCGNCGLLNEPIKR